MAAARHGSPISSARNEGVIDPQQARLTRRAVTASAISRRAKLPDELVSSISTCVPDEILCFPARKFLAVASKVKDSAE